MPSRTAASRAASAGRISSSSRTGTTTERRGASPSTAPRVPGRPDGSTRPALRGAPSRGLHWLTVKAPKILAVASAIDLDFRYGCTPAWWQLWKGMYEAGVDLVVTPYRGRPVESPWWRTAPNPTYREAETYASLRGGLARLKGDR